MKITIGEWKTRDGRKAIVAACNPNAGIGYEIIGWIGVYCCSWDNRGSKYLSCESPDDLIVPFSESSASDIDRINQEIRKNSIDINQQSATIRGLLSRVNALESKSNHRNP